jgi:hypothetical protein
VDALFYRNTATHKTALSYQHTTVQASASGNVAMILYRYIMLHERKAVDDAVTSNPCSSIDDCPVHNDGTVTQDSMT